MVFPLPQLVHMTALSFFWLEHFIFIAPPTLSPFPSPSLFFSFKGMYSIPTKQQISKQDMDICFSPSCAPRPLLSGDIHFQLYRHALYTNSINCRSIPHLSSSLCPSLLSLLIANTFPLTLLPTVLSALIFLLVLISIAFCYLLLRSSTNVINR